MLNLNVRLACLAAVLLAMGAVPAAANDAAVEIARRPIVISYNKGNPNTSFIVYVRLNHALPSSPGGRPLGHLTINAHYDSPRLQLVSSRRHCYSQEFTPVVPAPSLANAHVDDVVLVALVPGDSHRGSRLERYSDRHAKSDPDLYYGKRLGCFDLGNAVESVGVGPDGFDVSTTKSITRASQSALTGLSRSRRHSGAQAPGSVFRGTPSISASCSTESCRPRATRRCWSSDPDEDSSDCGRDWRALGVGPSTDSKAMSAPRISKAMHIVGRPFIYPLSVSQPYGELRMFVQLNRALPTGSDSRPTGAFQLDGLFHSVEDEFLYRDTSPACYSQTFRVPSRLARRRHIVGEQVSIRYRNTAPRFVTASVQAVIARRPKDVFACDKLVALATTSRGS